LRLLLLPTVITLPLLLPLLPQPRRAALMLLFQLPLPP